MSFVSHGQLKKSLPVLVCLILFSPQAGPGFPQDAGSHTQQDLRFLKADAEDSILPLLTEEERKWLAEHPVIRVVQDPGWPPVEFADGKGRPAGISNDYLKLIEGRLGISFERVRNLSWQEAYARLKLGDIDMTTSLSETPGRRDYWVFTKPYMKIPIVILTNSDITYISNMKELSGKQVAVVDGYLASERLPVTFPGIELVPVKTVEEGISLVENKEVFAFIDNMLVIGYYLAKSNRINLKIAGEAPFENAQSMAVRKDWPVLAGILQKALDSVSEEEAAAIYQKWVPIRWEHGFDYKTLWYAIAVFAAILSVLGFWTWMLVGEIKSRKQAEAALRESGELFRTIASSTPDHIIMQDRQLRYTHVVNPQLGLTEEEMLGKTDSELFPRGEAEHLTRAKNQVLNTAAALKFKTSLISKDGEEEFFDGIVIPRFDKKGEADGIVGYFHNVTETRRAEKTLRESEQQFHSLFDNMTEGVALHTLFSDENGDPVNYRIVHVNPAFERIIGFSKDEAFGKLATDLYGTSEPPYRAEFFRAALQREAVIFETYFPPLEKHFLVSAVPWGENGFATIFQDITERHLAENKIRELNSTLERRVQERTVQLQDAVQDLKSFSYSVSHDLRAPLRAISGFAEIVCRRHSGNLSEEGRHYVTNIVEASSRMGRLIDDLLNYSRVGRSAFDLMPVQLVEVYSDLSTDFAARFRDAGGTLTVQDESPIVLGDRTLLGQIFTNLVDNALTYRRKGIPLQVALTHRVEGPAVIVCVADNGIGIAMEHQAKIFNVFQRLHSDDSYPGTGIGLATVRKAVGLLGGKVWVESEPGKGSRFSIQLQRGET